MGRIDLFGLDIQSIKKLNNEESVSLLKRIKNGDKKAKDLFVMSNLKLVLSLVQKYGYKKDIEDLFEVGVLGLLKAIDGFDMSYNVRFSTYAVPMILGEIRKLNKDNLGIKVPRSMRDIAYRALLYKNEYESTHMSSPTTKEISNHLNVQEKDVVFAIDAVADTVSLQDTIYDDGEDKITLMDQIADPKESEDKWINYLLLKDGINSLNKKQRMVIGLRYYLSKTQKEIADILKVSQAQVSRLESDSINRLKLYFAE